MSLKAFIKRNPALKAAVKGLLRLSHPFLTAWMKLCHRLLPLRSDTAFFSSFDGRRFNDNVRAVAEALHDAAPDCRIVVELSRGERRGLPDWVVPVPRASAAALRQMATARVIVKSAALLPWMRVFPDQYFVQTWHGDRGFKRVRLDAIPGRPWVCREGREMSLAVSGSDFGSRVYRSAFAYEGEILEVGCPRNDVLVNGDAALARRTREALGIPADIRVLLYAPTFRDGGDGTAPRGALRLDTVRETLERATGERWMCLARSHNLVSGGLPASDRDVSAWPETSSLLLITDLLITDYSSIGGDFMLLNRPVVFYQPDSGDYASERGLYFDPDRSPLIVAHSEEELLTLLSRPIDGPANCRAVLDFFGTHETGHAAAAVAERVARALSRRTA